MKIYEKMDLYQLAERMGRDADMKQAAQLRAILVGTGRYLQTEDVPHGEWLKMLDSAMDQGDDRENRT